EDNVFVGSGASVALSWNDPSGKPGAGEYYVVELALPDGEHVQYKADAAPFNVPGSAYARAKGHYSWRVYRYSAPSLTENGPAGGEPTPGAGMAGSDASPIWSFEWLAPSPTPTPTFTPTNTPTSTPTPTNTPTRTHTPTPRPTSTRTRTPSPTRPLPTTPPA